jgi:protein-L-isoaspartate(D-aspartate) O-methyltransferase
MSTPATAKELVALLEQEGISNKNVLDAIAATPRHLFIDPSLHDKAYWDRPLSLSHGQTISQPFVVARMTELLLANGPLTKVLEIGTGSGYQAAVLAQLVNEVYTIERIYPLHMNANKIFQQLKLNNIFARYSDGNAGWPEHAPFEGIIVTAAAPELPHQLLIQLKEGGRMIIPVGERSQQQLQLIIRKGKHYQVEKLDPVIFVPLLTGTQE